MLLHNEKKRGNNMSDDPTESAFSDDRSNQITVSPFPCCNHPSPTCTESTGLGVFYCERPGPNSFATSELGLPVCGEVQINGTTDLEHIIQFGTCTENVCYLSGVINHIVLKRNTGPVYDYVLEVTGRAVSCGYLRFWDMTGDYYRLSICKNIVDTHTVRYNSANPVINKIEWSNNPF